MPAVTLDITPDLESRLRREAAREGLDTQGYILSTLRERLAGIRRSAVPRLAADEAALLQEINRGLPAETWQHYGELKEKRRAQTLTPEERAELIALSDQIEEMNVRRMEAVVELARLRHMSVDALMDDLGIKSPLYE
ncbi:MAG: hypothetical protein GY856_48820 [bacterium]|nr:hypothetical protein [bacterium]